jgi:hypothetical protein
MESDTLGALLRYDVVVVLRQGRQHLAVELVLVPPNVDSRVGAFRYAGTAVDAILVDKQSHFLKSS